MTGTRFLTTLNFPGALSADAPGEMIIPSGLIGATLIGISLSSSTAAGGTLTLGNDTTADACAAALPFGTSNTPIAYKPADFDGSEVDAVNDRLGFKFTPGEIITWTVNYGSGLANATVVLEFTEG